MKVRAKFYVYSKTLYADTCAVLLQPVTSGSEENKTFWKYTPSGKLEMNVAKEVGDMFEIGQEFYLDFTPASEA